MSSLRLTHQLQQKMVLTPQLRQRIEMLQMTAIELNELIEQELVANPVLEEVMPGEEVQEISENILDQNSEGQEEVFENGHDPDANLLSEPVADYADAEPYMSEMPLLNGDGPASTTETAADDDVHTESTDSFDEIDYGREFQDYLDPGYRTQEIEYKDDAPSFEQFLTHSESLSEHLEWQLHLLDLNEETEEAATLVIGNLDDDGRLSASIEEIAGMANTTLETAERARQAVMSLDPVGCGAFSVNECLLAQLASAGEANSLAAELVIDHLEDLQPHRLQHLSKKTGVDLPVLDREIEKIR